MNMSQLPVPVKRLFSPIALPGWLLLGWKVLNFVSNIAFAISGLKRAWTFLLSPLGNLLTTVFGLAWLFASAYVPRKDAPTSAAPNDHPSVDRNNELTEVYADVVLDWLKSHCRTTCMFTTQEMAKDVNLSIDRVGIGLGRLEKLALVSRDALSWKFVAANAVRAVPGYTRRRDLEPKPDAACEALKAIVNADAEKLTERIKQISQRVEFHYNPGTDPSLDIITELWNGSVFELVNFGEISGHVTYTGRQLAGDPRIIASVEPIVLSLHHAGTVTFIVRQYLSSETADMMEANRHRQIAINFESVCVRFKVLPFLVEGTTSFAWYGPRFAIEDTVRV